MRFANEILHFKGNLAACGCAGRQLCWGFRTGGFLRGIIAKPTIDLSKMDAPIHDFGHDVASSRRYEFRRKFTFFSPVPKLDLAVLKFFERVGHDWHIAKLSWTNLPDLALNFGEYRTEFLPVHFIAKLFGKE